MPFRQYGTNFYAVLKDTTWQRYSYLLFKRMQEIRHSHIVSVYPRTYGYILSAGSGTSTVVLVNGDATLVRWTSTELGKQRLFDCLRRAVRVSAPFGRWSGSTETNPPGLRVSGASTAGAVRCPRGIRDSGISPWNRQTCRCSSGGRRR